MTQPKWIHSMHAMIEQTDAFILDVWGVIYDGKCLYPHIKAFITALHTTNKPYVLLSNAPRTAAMIQEKLGEMSLKIDRRQIITSGDMTRSYLIDETVRSSKKVYYHLGADTNTNLLSHLPIRITEQLEEAHVLIVSKYLDPGDNLHQFDDIFQRAISLSIPVICPNPDLTVIHGSEKRYCAGYFCQQFESMGGDVTYIGKPYPNAFYQALKTMNCDPQSAERVTMIGDTIETDIIGANQIGLSTCLVLTGNMGIELGNTPPNRLTEEVEGIFKVKNCYPNWVFSPIF